MKTKHLMKPLAMICLVTFILSACTVTPIPSQTQPATTQPGTATAAPETPTKPAATSGPTDKNVYPDVFASYPAITVNLPAAYAQDYTLPLDLSAFSNLDSLELTATQKAALEQNGFVAAPPATDPNQMYKEFYAAYESIRYAQTPVFITTDSIFHVYHLIFDKMLRDLERQQFIAMVKSLTSAMVKESQSQYDQLKGTPLEEQALRNLAYFGVAATLLKTGDTVPSEAKALVDAEVALIDAHSEYAVSPIWDREDLPTDMKLIEDYTQYTPRGHYTLSAELEDYFKAMMWYGRLTFRLTDAFETQRALLMVQAMTNAKAADGTQAMSLWENIYDPTVFIVGKADDLSIYEYKGLSDQIFGTTPDLASFADAAKMAAFNEAAKSLPPPQINSMWVWIWQDRDQVTTGFRFMGQRFTLDQYVFGQVMWRKVGTDTDPRDLPVALDFFAAQGSAEADAILAGMGETHYANYTTQMDKVKGQVATLGTDSWTQNLYWSWLYALQPVFAVKNEQYPAFMRTQAWVRKDLQTALGSWTELKHDTILYAKQVMAEMGGGPAPKPPHGYVEPNPEAFARLLALAQMTRDGLASRDLLTDTTMGNIDALINQLNFLQRIAESEMSGTAISDDDYWQIQYYGGWLESMTTAAADPTETGGRPILEDQKSALVADVATGIGRVLEEGVGYPTMIYVAVPGSNVIAQGAIYTYYEFQVTPDKRMTDENWRSDLESGTAPKAPEWTSSFIVQ